MVDLVEDFYRLHGDAPPAEEIPPSPTPATAVAGLVTHMHSDHADIDALGRALTSSAVVLRPESSYVSKAETALIEKSGIGACKMSGLATRVVEPSETVRDRHIRSFTSLPATYGFGDPQVSWCIAADGCRILHAGYTLFHGCWWLSALRHWPLRRGFSTRRRCDSRSSFTPAAQSSTRRHGRSGKLP